MTRPRAAVAVVSALVMVGALAVNAPTAHAEQPLAGRLILLDPGHQLGNANPRFADELASTRFNGTSRKACNATGTATNAGLPESTFVWRVATRLRALLEEQGAEVAMTRSSNTWDAWGPCTWDRAAQANRLNADAMVSIHADGSAAPHRGFFVLTPGLVRGWTEDVVKPGRRLARAMIRGMAQAGAPPSNYISDQTLVSTNTTSLNVSNVPTVTVELGNMRNRADARLMSSREGQGRYAQWLLAGLLDYFSRD